jgi:hypothetical protein
VKPVIVTWLDAHADRSGGWCFPGDLDDKPYTVHSIGYLIDPPPKADHVSIAQSVGDDEALDHVLHVPKGMVQSIAVP